MSNIAENLKEAVEVLHAAKITEPRRQAVSLLGFALQKDKTFLIAHAEYELSAAEEKSFRELLKRRSRREPFQYITGRQEFCGLDFLVTPDVLIPRSETEIVVEHAIEILRHKDAPQFCEVGIGSGCISVSILHALRTARATGFDISEKALQIARRNAETHRVSGRLDLEISDVYANLKDEKFDLIVSNPPYIAAHDIEDLQPEVRDYEPRAALTDDADGLSIIEKIVADAPRFLAFGGFLLMEIGYNQAAAARSMFAPQIWEAVEILPDLQGIPRTVKARIKS